MKPSLFIIIGVAFTFFLAGCFRSNDCDEKPRLTVNQEQLEADIENIEGYLEENDIEAEVHSSGIRYVIHTKGDGKKPSLCSAVSVTYEGRLMSNDNVFDGTDNAVSFAMGRLITGWKLGIPLVKEGGSITLYIPSVYGYGSQGSGDKIPANANLIFDIELKTVL